LRRDAGFRSELARDGRLGRRDVAEIFRERHRDAEDRPVVADHRDEVRHPELRLDACLAARRAFGPDSPGRVASVGAMTEISVRLAAGLQGAARPELQSRPALMEPRLPDAAPQERRVVRELREELGLA